MEATGEVESLQDKIRPPRLEDAGLEDCALPPELIKEAFLKAATAVGSRAALIFATSDEEGDASKEEGRCMNDLWPNVGESSDTLVGIRDGVDPPPGVCGAEKGGGMPEEMGDEVAASVTGAEERAVDKVVAGPNLPEGGGEACVDGLQGLKIGDHKVKGVEDKGKTSKSGEEDEEEQEGEIPILAEAAHV